MKHLKHIYIYIAICRKYFHVKMTRFSCLMASNHKPFLLFQKFAGIFKICIAFDLKI